MNRKKTTRNDAPDALTENAGRPDRIPPKKRVNIIVFLGAVLAALAVLAYGLFGLFTGRLLTTDEIILLHGKILAARSGNVLLALIFLCIALLFLVYAMYGLRRGGLRNIIPSRYTLSDTTYYQGLPMWFVFLSYISLSVYLIASAITLVYYDKHMSRASWKWEVYDVFLVLWLALLVAAGWAGQRRRQTGPTGCAGDAQEAVQQGLIRQSRCRTRAGGNYAKEKDCT